MHAKQLTIFIFLAVLSAFSMADTYKWTDKQGNVHYTQEKPLKYKFTKVNAPPPPPADSVDVNKEFASQIDKKAKDQGTQSTALSTANAENCALSKKNLEVIKSYGRVKYQNEEGETVLMTDEQKAARMRKTQKDIDYFCN